MNWRRGKIIMTRRSHVGVDGACRQSNHINHISHHRGAHVQRPILVRHNDHNASAQRPTRVIRRDAQQIIHRMRRSDVPTLMNSSKDDRAQAQVDQMYRIERIGHNANALSRNMMDMMCHNRRVNVPTRVRSRSKGKRDHTLARVASEYDANGNHAASGRGCFSAA